MIVVGVFHKRDLMTLVDDRFTGEARTFITRREAMRHAFQLSEATESEEVTYAALIVRFADQKDACAQGAHDINKSAFSCGACGKLLCEVCGSDEHRTNEGHDLNNPMYWGV